MRQIFPEKKFAKARVRVSVRPHGAALTRWLPESPLFARHDPSAPNPEAIPWSPRGRPTATHIHPFTPRQHHLPYYYHLRRHLRETVAATAPPAASVYYHGDVDPLRSLLSWTEFIFFLFLLRFHKTRVSNLYISASNALISSSEFRDY